ncbi:MAG: Mur ligase family protein, partial [Bacteroidota bacterium]|nr:Mur ligase family protein [Bacteroidota bacterium]
MKKLKDILYKVKIKEAAGSTNIPLASIGFDSREVAQDSLFVAVKGTRVDGHNYINLSIENGANAIICEVMPVKQVPEVTYIRVDDSKQALGIIAANFYDNPSEDIILIGVTGTNGKTTIVTLLFQLFQLMGFGVGMLSTIRNQIDRRIVDSTHTTPDPVQINKLLRAIVNDGCDYVFMEVSSHAIDQGRIAGLDFNGGIFSNITHEHLDYHPSFKDYLGTKKRFFDELPPHAFALSNSDDKNGKVILQNTKARKFTYGLKSA